MVKAAVTCHRTFITSVLARREGSVVLVDVLCTGCYAIQERCALAGDVDLDLAVVVALCRSGQSCQAKLSTLRCCESSQA